jgi:hypothetical protein
MALINIKSVGCARADPSLVGYRNRPSFDFCTCRSRTCPRMTSQVQPMPLHLAARSSTIHPHDLLLQWHSRGEDTLTRVLGAHCGLFEWHRFEPRNPHFWRASFDLCQTNRCNCGYEVFRAVGFHVRRFENCARRRPVFRRSLCMLDALPRKAGFPISMSMTNIDVYKMCQENEKAVRAISDINDGFFETCLDMRCDRDAKTSSLLSRQADHARPLEDPGKRPVFGRGSWR